MHEKTTSPRASSLVCNHTRDIAITNVQSEQALMFVQALSLKAPFLNDQMSLNTLAVQAIGQFNASFLNVQMTFDRSRRRSSLGLHGDDVCSHQFRPHSSSNDSDHYYSELGYSKTTAMNSQVQSDNIAQSSEYFNQNASNLVLDQEITIINPREDTFHFKHLLNSSSSSQAVFKSPSNIIVILYRTSSSDTNIFTIEDGKSCLKPSINTSFGRKAQDLRLRLHANSDLSFQDNAKGMVHVGQKHKDRKMEMTIRRWSKAQSQDRKA
ncbi:hypothetical protein Tco_0782964 [Tanacetum coccineum]